jgi:hypothetical protein
MNTQSPDDVTVHTAQWIDLSAWCKHAHIDENTARDALDNADATWGGANTMSFVDIRRLKEILRVNDIDVPVCMCFPHDVMVYIG